MEVPVNEVNEVNGARGPLAPKQALRIKDSHKQWRLYDFEALVQWRSR